MSDDEPILEGLVVSVDEAGRPNGAPMGPRVDRGVTRLVLRPFRTAQTYENLMATRHGVFHVTDDVLLLAQAAVGELELPRLVRVSGHPCPRLADCCRWLAFVVEQVDESQERATLVCRVTKRGEVRPFFGFNRAKHAVLEAAILATRIGILPAEEVRRELVRLRVPVEKTAGCQERQAFEYLEQYVAGKLE